MNDGHKQKFIYLDGATERQQLIAEVRRARQEVIQIAERVPEEQWYEPRYENWSLAALLGHLNMVDNLSMLLVKMALLGLHPKVSPRNVERLRGFTASIFRRRLVPTSIKSIKNNQKRIAEFIEDMPLDKFSMQVYDPIEQQYTTVERALQIFFLFNWQNHLATLREVEGIQPPERPDSA